MTKHLLMSGWIDVGVGVMDKHIATPEHVALWDAINRFRDARNTEQKMCAVPEVEDAIRKLLADREAEIERLRADLVWAVRKGVMVGHDECVRPCIWFDVHRGVEYDGTPDSICRAVREARDGE